MGKIVVTRGLRSTMVSGWAYDWLYACITIITDKVWYEDRELCPMYRYRRYVVARRQCVVDV